MDRGSLEGYSPRGPKRVEHNLVTKHDNNKRAMMYRILLQHVSEKNILYFIYFTYYSMYLFNLREKEREIESK